jgi:hypothetical protein
LEENNKNFKKGRGKEKKKGKNGKWKKRKKQRNQKETKSKAPHIIIVSSAFKSPSCPPSFACKLTNTWISHRVRVTVRVRVRMR